jgi:hypothetical protein
MSLDDRLASAADAVRSTVRRDPPSFAAVRSRSRRRRAIGAGVATVLVAVLAVFVVAPLTDSGPRGGTVSARPGGDRNGHDASSCVDVFRPDGSRAGCVLSTDANAGAARVAELTARFGGVPVYRDASAQVQVGVLVPDLGFVRSDLVPQLAELRACWPAVQNMLADPVAAPLDPSCHALMAALGYPESFLEGKGYGR